MLSVSHCLWQGSREAPRLRRGPGEDSKTIHSRGAHRTQPDPGSWAESLQSRPTAAADHVVGLRALSVASPQRLLPPGVSERPGCTHLPQLRAGGLAKNPLAPCP